MAIQTKTLTANGSKGHHKFTLKVNEETTSGNSSFMSYSFTIAPIQNGWDWYGFNIPFSVKIGTNTYTGSISSYNGSSTVTLSSGSNIEIAHNTDGTKTIDISFSVTDNTGQSYTCGNASSSSTFKLTDLHKPPLFNSITFVENSSVLQNIGLNATDFVPYLSNKTATISATTYDGATITQYKIINGTTNFTSSTNVVNLNFSVDGREMAYYYETAVSREIPQLIIELTDNKGGVSSYNYTNTRYVMYAKPNLVQTSSSVKRNGQLSGKVIMNLVGTFYGSTVGTKSNSVTLSYKYWKTNVTEPSTYFPITGATTSGNVVNVNNWNVAKSGTPITDVDSNSSYYFKVKMVDAFSKESYITLNVPIGEYIRALLKDRVDFKEISIGLNKYLSQLGQSIQVGLAQQQTITSNTTTLVNVSNVLYNTSSSLSYSNNKVYIGKGVTSVLVNCRYTAWGANSSGRYIYIYKNGSVFAFNERAYSHTMETTAIISVQEGDYIEMYCYSEQSENITISNNANQTYLQVAILG